jgi:hypothetical protein
MFASRYPKRGLGISREPCHPVRSLFHMGKLLMGESRSTLAIVL